MESVEKMFTGQHISLFVTGTDTSVGKTFVCALLLDFMRNHGIAAGYQKWVSTGSSTTPEDLAFCRQRGLSPADDELALQVPFRFSFAASPHLAAEQEGKEVDPARIISSHAAMLAKYQLLIVEGVGGVLVPLRRDLLLADLVARLGLSTLIVARTGLGTINHTLLTIEALRSRKVPVLGVIFSDATSSEDEIIAADNLRTIQEMGSVHVFGRLPRCLDHESARQGFAPIGKAVLSALPL